MVEVFGPLEVPVLVEVVVLLGAVVFGVEGLGLEVVVFGGEGDGLLVVDFEVVRGGDGDGLFPPRPPPRCGLAEAMSVIINTTKMVKWERQRMLYIGEENLW